MCGVYGAVAAESNDFRRNVVTRISPYLPDDLLAKLDRASMAASLEERAPFMDRALVERVCRLPIEHKMRGVATKRALRRAIADPVPPPIRLDPRVFRRASVHALLDVHVARPRDNRREVWALIMLQLWRDRVAR